LIVVLFKLEDGDDDKNEVGSADKLGIIEDDSDGEVVISGFIPLDTFPVVDPVIINPLFRIFAL
jgi:hypothetical protein